MFNANITEQPGHPGNVTSVEEGVGDLLSRCRPPLIWATGFSLLINVLMLTSSLYMMQVYDRVLPSGSLPTLLFLSLITAGALALLSALDFVRTRLLGTLGDWLERRLAPPILERMVEGTLLGRREGTALLKDIGTLHSVLGNGATFLFDVPWVPVYLALIYALHPVLGHLAVTSAALLFILALINDRITRACLREATAASNRAIATAEAALRNAEVVDAMHLLPGLARRWGRDHSHALDAQDRAHRRGAVLLNITKFVRQLVQVALLGAGAWLVVRLDGADLFQWRRDDVGRHIGYLPQDVELFAGSVAENIARMGEPDPQAVVEAATLADCHAMILRLPQGYDTQVGDGGAFLSGGQRQRVALARALYGAPKLVVLDEPNASLDAEGEQALNRAITALKERGACVIVIGHRPGTLAQVDRILALRDGRVESFGPRAEVLEALKRRTMHPVAARSAPPIGAGDRPGPPAAPAPKLHSVEPE